jgi:hypothetical protein
MVKVLGVVWMDTDRGKYHVVSSGKCDRPAARQEVFAHRQDTIHAGRACAQHHGFKVARKVIGIQVRVRIRQQINPPGVPPLDATT